MFHQPSAGFSSSSPPLPEVVDVAVNVNKKVNVAVSNSLCTVKCRHGRPWAFHGLFRGEKKRVWHPNQTCFFSSTSEVQVLKFSAINCLKCVFYLPCCHEFTQRIRVSQSGCWSEIQPSRLEKEPWFSRTIFYSFLLTFFPPKLLYCLFNPRRVNI